MRKRKIISLLFIIIVLVLMATVLSGCVSTNKRVQEALEKMENSEKLQMKCIMDATLEFDMMPTSVEMEIDADIKIDGEDIVMISEIDSDFMDMTMEMYMIEDDFYMYIPQVVDKYIDGSEIMTQIYEEGIGMDLTIFDFDVENTEIEAEETMILFQGNEVDVLEVQVLLDDEQITDIIRNLMSQQNFSTDTLSGQSLDTAVDMYESLEVEYAEYTLYIDKNNNVLRYEIDSVFNMEMMGEGVTYDMEAKYDIISTEESIVVELPDIDENDVITLKELQSGTF